MQCDLLVPDLQSQGTMALVKENIKCISNGSSPYRAGALNLVLEKGIRVQVQGKGKGCEIARIALGCRGPNFYTMHAQCAECGWNKTHIRYLPCKNCGKDFVLVGYRRDAGSQVSNIFRLVWRSPNLPSSSCQLHSVSRTTISVCVSLGSVPLFFERQPTTPGHRASWHDYPTGETGVVHESIDVIN
jgi:hypothetical protein